MHTTLLPLIKLLPIEIAMQEICQQFNNMLMYISMKAFSNYIAHGPALKKDNDKQ